MKRFISFILVFVILLSTSISVSAENPTDTHEDFTIEETIALLMSADIGMKITYKDGSIYTDTVSPISIGFPEDSEHYGYASTMYLPIGSNMMSTPIKSIDLTFYFPFTVKSLGTLYFAFAPIVYSSTSTEVSYPNLYRYYNFTYQADNTNSSVGSQVVSSFSTNVTSSDGVSSTLTSSSYYITYVGGNHFFSYNSSSFLFDFGTSICNSLIYRSKLNCNFKDINTFGFSWTPQANNTSVSSNFAGIGFVFSPMSISYLSGGGYVPVDDPGGGDPGGGDSGGGDPGGGDPGGGDPGGGDSIDYSEKLDDIYHMMITQNVLEDQRTGAIMQNIDENVDRIIGALDTPTDEDTEKQDELTDNFNETQEKADEIKEALGSVEFPDVDEFDFSVPDEADGTYVTPILGLIFSDSLVLMLLICSISIMLLSTILFGKKT